MAAGLLAVSLVGCSTMSSTNNSSTITKADFGKTPDGQAVELYTLRNSKGAEADIMTYGGIVQKLLMPDKNGKFADVVQGFDTLDGYTAESYVKACPYFGALIGRYGNRIGGATSNWKAKRTPWPRTTMAIRSTAASKVLTKWSGPRGRPSLPTDRNWCWPT